MEIKHLQYFITVAKLGSINKAAQELYIAQPNLGKILKRLEDAAGTVLLYRNRQGVTLTPDGEAFLRKAEKIVSEMDGLFLFGNEEKEKMSSLSVSMTKFSHILDCYMEVVLNHKNDAFFSHRLDEGSPEEVIEDVLASRADIGVLNFDSHRRSQIVASIEERGLTYRKLASYRPHILLSANHPLIKAGEEISLRSLTEYGFVRYLGQYEDFTYRITLENGDHNLNLSRKIVYVSSRSALLRLISSSDFYGIGIHDFSVQESAYRVLSFPIEECEGMLEFGTVTRKNSPTTEIMQEFMDVLKSRM